MASDIDWKKLLAAIKEVESKGNENKKGDGGRSIGAYQISAAYYKDAVKFNRSLEDDEKSYQDVAGPGSSAYAEEVIKSYMGRYATEARLGHKPTAQDIARIHNGGPEGYRKDVTLAYWEKVKKHM